MSPWASAVVMVKKAPLPEDKNAPSRSRSCVDYRQLNQQTIPDSYPLPGIPAQIREISPQHKVFSKLDLSAAFHQVPMQIEATAFISSHGLFEYVRMPFGFTPAYFQRMMDTILAVPIKEGYVKIMIDDILIVSLDIATHMTHLSNVIDILIKNNLVLNWDKCAWILDSIQYAGYHIDQHGTKLLSNTIQKLDQVPVPTTRKQVQSFLGLVNYGRKYIPNLSSHTKGLNAIVGKSNRSAKEAGNSPNTSDDAITMTPLAIEEFHYIKNILSKNYYLTQADDNLPFHLYTDASDDGIGWVLFQYPNDDTTKEGLIIRCGSRSLPKRKRKHSATERETMALKAAVKDCLIWIDGKRTTLWTDHQPLSRDYKTDPTSNQNSLLIEWILNYRLNIRYINGKLNVVADALSRLIIQQEVIEEQWTDILPKYQVAASA